MWLTGDRHASSCQRHRHHRRMIVVRSIAPHRFGRYVPDCSEPAPIRTAYDVNVVVVVLVLGKQKYRLMRLRRAISNRLRVRVRLVPDDLRPKPPPRVLEREGKPPREADQILRFQPLRRHRAHRHCTSSILFVRRAIATIAGRVGVTDVEPNRAVVGEYPAELFEHRHDALQIVVERIVATNLSIDFVIPERPVRRRGDHGLDAPGGQQLHRLARAPAHQNRLPQCDGLAGITGVETHMGCASCPLWATAGTAGFMPGDVAAGRGLAHRSTIQWLDAHEFIVSCLTLPYHPLLVVGA